METEGNRDCVFPAWGWVHGIGRTISELCGWSGRARRWVRARAGVEHGVWAGDEDRAVAGRGRGFESSLRGCEVAQADTEEVPDSGPTVASRTVMVVGNLVRSAALGILQTLVAEGRLKENYSRDEFRAACRRRVEEKGEFRSWARYEAPAGIFWDDEKYRGEAYAAYAWAVYVAEVAVDLNTYTARVEDFVALQEVGKVLHPVLAEGQIAGGVAQAIGFALYEKVVWQNGRMLNNQMTNYIMPTSADVPPIRVFFEEKGNVHGAYGAKGIGELPMDGPAPAIANAIEDAIKTRFDSIPLMPEDIFQARAAR